MKQRIETALLIGFVIAWIGVTIYVARELQTVRPNVIKIMRGAQ